MKKRYFPPGRLHPLFEYGGSFCFPKKGKGNTAQLRYSFQIVIPAKAGIQWALVIAGIWMRRLDSRLRENDEIMGLRLTEQHEGERGRSASGNHNPRLFL